MRLKDCIKSERVSISFFIYKQRTWRCVAIENQHLRILSLQQSKRVPQCSHKDTIRFIVRSSVEQQDLYVPLLQVFEPWPLVEIANRICICMLDS